MKKIYFKDPDTRSLKLLLKSLYRIDNVYSVMTYSNKNLTKVECHGKRRSFEDLFCIANTYFPKTKKEELMEALMDINILFYRCGGIRKIVFHYKGSNHIDENAFRNYFISNDNGKIEAYVEKTHTPLQLQRILNKVHKKRNAIS